MKSHKEWMYVGLTAAIIILLYFLFIRKNQTENSFGGHGGGGRGFGGRGFGHRGHRHYHGGGGWLGWGYPIPYDYYDVYDPIAVTTTDCPKGWIWMGAMLGCQKPQGI